MRENSSISSIKVFPRFMLRVPGGVALKLKCATVLALWAVGGFLTSKIWGQAAGAQSSVAGLVDMALSRNREYLALRERLTETQALLRQAGLRPAPTIETEFSTGRPLGTPGEEEYSTGLFQTIETAGKRGKREAVARKAADLAEAELEEGRRQLAFEVKTRYAEAQGAQAKVAAFDRLMSAGRESYRLTEARVREGDAAPLEQTLFLADLNRSEAQQALFKGSAQSAILELKQAVGLGPSDALKLVDVDDQEASLSVPGDAPSLAQLQETALKQRPDFKIARLVEEQSTAEVTLEQAEGRPDLTASTRYVYRHSEFPQLGLNASGTPVPLIDRDNILAFGLSVPLFTGKRTKGAVEAAVARQGAARLRREFLESNIPTQVEAAYHQWEAARRSVSIFSSGVVAQSQENLAVVRESYRLGQLRILDVLNEQRRLIDTQLAYVDAETELAKAFAELERSVGGDLQ